MGLLTRVADWFGQASPTPPTAFGRAPGDLLLRGAYDPDRLPDWLGPRSADWAAWDDGARLAAAVRTCTVVWACATFLADAVAEAPLEVYRTGPDGEKDVATDRPAGLCRDLLANPNPYTSGSEFLLTLVLGQCVWGYAAVEKVRPQGTLDLPVQLWTLRPDWLQRRQRASSADRYWQYPKPDGGTRAIEDRDVLIVPYYPDPWRGAYGICPAQVAAREIGIDSSLTDFLKTFLDAGGIPPFVLTHPDPIYDPATITAMQERWRQKYGGAKAYANLPVLHGGYDIKPVGTDMDAMAWPDLRGLTEQKIAQAHRVPLELIQGQMALSGGPLTSTQFEGAMAVLQRYGAAPLRSRIDAVFTRGVLAEFTGGDPSYDLAFDTTGILALQEDEEALHARIRADWQAGLITLNEARRGIGEAELPGQGDVLAVPFSTTLTPVDALLPTATPPAAAIPAKAAPVYRDTAMLSAGAIEVRASSLARTRKERQRLTEIGTRALRTFWREQGARIVAALTQGTGVRAQGSGRTNAFVSADPRPLTPVPSLRVAEPIDWVAEEVDLARVLLRFYHANGQAAFAAVADLLDVDIDWTLANPNVQRVVHDLGKRIVAIAEQTRQDVTRTVDAALGEGVTIDELASRLSTLFTETYRGRAETVSRTESATAFNKASTLGYAESGQVDEVELADNPAHDTDPLPPTMTTCAERDGLVVPLAQADAYTDSIHPNCQLAVLPIVRPRGEEEA